MTFRPFLYVFPAAVFSSPDGELMTYTCTQADGSPLPGWLSFDASTRTLAGTPPDLAPISLLYTATDAGGLSTSNPEFTITPEHVARPPVVDQPITDFVVEV